MYAFEMGFPGSASGNKPTCQGRRRALMYRLMYTRALLQSKDHSVGSKRYLSRLEKRVKAMVFPAVMDIRVGP